MKLKDGGREGEVKKKKQLLSAHCTAAKGNLIKLNIITVIIRTTATFYNSNKWNIDRSSHNRTTTTTTTRIM